MHKTLSPGEFAFGTQRLKLGDRVKMDRLLGSWVSLGYESVETVEQPGTFSRRGGILDIYPPTSELPVRIELFGDEVESLRRFDPLTQRAVELVSELVVTPCRERLEGRPPSACLLDHLPEGALLVLDDPQAIRAMVEELDGQAEEVRQQRAAAGEGTITVAEPRPYFRWAELEAKVAAVPRQLALSPWSDGGVDESTLSFSPPSFYGGRLRLLLEEVLKAHSEGAITVIASHQAGRISELLQERGIFPALVDEVAAVPTGGSVTLVRGSLKEGWSLMLGGGGPPLLILLTDAEIFGYVKPQRPPRRRAAGREVFLADLRPGDYVVHVEHGVGRFVGLARLPVDGGEKEYMLLDYAEGDRLYVPLDQIDRVSRYLGGEGQEPALTRLGSQDWARAKERARRSAVDIARELLEIYARRELSTGFAFSPDTPWQRELEDAFPYVETPDQLEAIRQVKQDMEAPRPMDRLICGDVGYGKTEVALRAAFKAVMDGKQVALLVPTTVLAQQHFATFSERLAPFPVRVEVLSRFRSEGEQRAVLEGLSNGSIDICIGTHRLLQKDVRFKSLGLLIIDEEQRFGVMHKEYLKKMRQEVDVLTMTATPIPRTLYMSLASVRDMSVIETPPEERLPIKTFVMPYDEATIREAVLRELDRGGQVFFVHNRVQDIHHVAYRLRRLIPEAEIAIGHGQMPEEELEQVMLDFFAGKVDLLVCTTIIEAGLDVPNANTIIVNRADRFGLAQLYQLRGRVGRGANLAYAYLLFSKDTRLRGPAEERLRTILEASELGAGYRIAMKDLEIRGAGNILGPEQSGHISAVGFDLYCRMLAEAVEELRARQAGREVAPPPSIPSIELPLAAFIPEGYIANPAQRISFYQRLARVASLEELADLGDELRDRFGAEPEPVDNLLYVVALRVLGGHAGVSSIARRNGEVVVSLGGDDRLDRTLFQPLGQTGLWVGSQQIRLHLRRLGSAWKETLRRVVETLALSRAGTKPG
jgi:transcription-repair coupling factor (superfamily II helicase)